MWGHQGRLRHARSSVHMPIHRCSARSATALNPFVTCGQPVCVQFSALQGLGYKLWIVMPISLYTVLLIGSAKHALAWAQILPLHCSMWMHQSCPPQVCVVLASIHVHQMRQPSRTHPLVCTKGEPKPRQGQACVCMYVRMCTTNQMSVTFTWRPREIVRATGARCTAGHNLSLLPASM